MGEHLGSVADRSEPGKRKWAGQRGCGMHLGQASIGAPLSHTCGLGSRP
jgi:hypothetical protein